MLNDQRYMTVIFGNVNIFMSLPMHITANKRETEAERIKLYLLHILFNTCVYTNIYIFHKLEWVLKVNYVDSALLVSATLDFI